MNNVDISPETVEREYAAISEKWGVVTPIEAPEAKPETLTPEPNFEPERISSPQSLAAQREIDVPLSTLQKWEHDEEVSPELIRNNIHVTREFIAENVELVIEDMADLEVERDKIDKFALSNAKLLVHYYPRGGVMELMENYGLWFGSIASTAGLIFAVRNAAIKKEQTTNAAALEEEQQ